MLVTDFSLSGDCSVVRFQITSAQQAILQRTNQAYYNLPSQGLVEFQCVVVPDWSVTLKEELHQDFPPDHPAIKALNGIHFWLALDEKGSAKLTHKLDEVPTDPKTLEGYNQTISGVAEVLTGFSQSVTRIHGEARIALREDGREEEGRDRL